MRQELHLAALRDDTDTLARLLDSGADVDGRDAHGSTPAMLAARFGALGALRLLVERGADLSARNNLGATAVRHAVEHRRYEALAALLAAGADPNESYPADADPTPLHKAAGAASEEAAATLLSFGADPNAAAPAGGYTALHRAAERAERPLVQILLEVGAQIDRADDDGDTPLFWAVVRRRSDNALLLLDRGADASVANARGETALSLAREHGADSVLLSRLEGAARTGGSV